MKKCWLYDECNHIDCDKFCMRKYKLDFLYDKAGISLQQRKRAKFVLDPEKTDLDAFNRLKTISNDIVNWVDNGYNLYIHSPVTGNGKTLWTLRMVQDYFNAIWAKSPLKCRVLFINVPRFLIEIKENISVKSDYITNIKENCFDCDLIVWDEIGTKGLTQFEHENVLSIVNARIDAGKSNIYTSNLSNDELREAVGERLYSRIVNYSENIIFYGTDKRGISV